MKCKRTVVIMAGGSGERFYPLSRTVRPKQLLPLVSAHTTMIEEAIGRVSPLIPPQDIYIITSIVLQPVIRHLLKNVPAENIIAEPFKRNTAPCLALAAAVIIARYQSTHSPEQISIAVLTADQYISDVNTFREQVSEALSFAETHKDIVTLGITPTRPETGYGYIEVAELLDTAMRRVKSFREKPGAERAAEFLRTGSFLWNSGMFFYRCDTFLEGMGTHAAEIALKIPEMIDAIRSKASEAVVGSFTGIVSLYEQFPDVSIDYALMEVADNVAVLPSRFGWDDVGSWDSLDRTNEHDASGNVVVGMATLIDTQNSIVANYADSDAMMVSVIGLDNIVVVTTNDSIVVCPKDRVQDVKKAVALMRTRNQEKFL